ncbi:MAG: hypothetical protein LDL50_06765 [Chloroflexi bacterium]|nr:hypothetical protein [Chloroflexota bacterium]
MMSFAEALVFVVAAILLGLTSLWKRKSPLRMRGIPALLSLRRALGLSVEDGTRLHISLGSASPLDGRGTSALAGLAALRRIAEHAAASDAPPVASAGDPALGLLSQDTMQAGYKTAGAEGLYAQDTGRAAGLTPFGYAAGAMHISPNENVSANILLGHFGPEAALIADAAERSGAVLIGASDNLTGQAVLFASAREALIGEELFAAGASLEAGAFHAASLTLQDLLRWLIILALAGGAALKFLRFI